MNPTSHELRDRVAVVTGATDGIGRALALRLAAEGAIVVGAGRDQRRLHALAPGVALALTLDVTDAGSVSTAASAVLDRFGRVDLLVNNAGQGLFRAWDQTTPAELARLLDVNVVGPARVAAAFLPSMVAAGQGALVNVASVAGLAGFPEQTAYAASKHALTGWSRALRRELAGSGVRVILVHPPVVRTAFFERAGKPDFFEHFRRRALSPEEAAEGVLAAIRRGAPEAVLGPGSLVAWARGALPVPLDLLLSRVRR